MRDLSVQKGSIRKGTMLTAITREQDIKKGHVYRVLKSKDDGKYVILDHVITPDAEGIEGKWMKVEGRFIRSSREKVKNFFTFQAKQLTKDKLEPFICAKTGNKIQPDGAASRTHIDVSNVGFFKGVKIAGGYTHWVDWQNTAGKVATLQKDENGEGNGKPIKTTIYVVRNKEQAERVLELYPPYRNSPKQWIGYIKQGHGIYEGTYQVDNYGDYKNSVKSYTIDLDWIGNIPTECMRIEASTLMNDVKAEPEVEEYKYKMFIVRTEAEAEHILSVYPPYNSTKEHWIRRLKNGEKFVDGLYVSPLFGENKGKISSYCANLDHSAWYAENKDNPKYEVIEVSHLLGGLVGYELPKVEKEQLTPESEMTIEEKVVQFAEMEVRKCVEGEQTRNTVNALAIASAQLELESKATKETIEKKVEGLLDEWGVPYKTKPVTIIIPNRPEVNVGLVHFKFDVIMQCIASRVNIAMVGPAGSGKTTTAKKAAEALKLEFYSKSVSAQTGVHEFFGYQDANGNYVRTLFREAYENGGVFLLDEFDAGNPNVLAALNAATANDVCAFADGMIKKHEDFVCIMAGNTFGHGATSEYVGRNKIDAATLDRFAFIDFPYDEDLEYELAPNKEWCREVQQYRQRVSDKKLKTVVSPRATFMGGQLLNAGMNKSEVIALTITKGMSEAEKNLIIQ